MGQPLRDLRVNRETLDKNEQFTYNETIFFFFPASISFPNLAFRFFPFLHFFLRPRNSMKSHSPNAVLHLLGDRPSPFGHASGLTEHTPTSSR